MGRFLDLAGYDLSVAESTEFATTISSKRKGTALVEFAPECEQWVEEFDDGNSENELGHYVGPDRRIIKEFRARGQIDLVESSTQELNSRR